MVVTPTILGAYFGRESYPLIAGYTHPINSIITAIGPLLAGLIYDSTGSYMLAFIIAAALIGVALVCALLARPPMPRMVTVQ